MNEHPASAAEGLDIPVTQVILHSQIAQAMHRLHVIIAVEFVLFSHWSRHLLVFPNGVFYSIVPYDRALSSYVQAEEPFSLGNKGRLPSRIRDGLPF
jgi:hypothetical protein